MRELMTDAEATIRGLNDSIDYNIEEAIRLGLQAEVEAELLRRFPLRNPRPNAGGDRRH